MRIASIVAALYFLRFFRNMFWHTTQTLLIIVRENGNNSHQLSVSSLLLLLLWLISTLLSEVAAGMCYPSIMQHYPIRDNYDMKVRAQDANFHNKSDDVVCQKAKTGKHQHLIPGVFVVSCIHGTVVGSTPYLTLYY